MYTHPRVDQHVCYTLWGDTRLCIDALELCTQLHTQHLITAFTAFVIIIVNNMTSKNPKRLKGTVLVGAEEVLEELDQRSDLDSDRSYDSIFEAAFTVREDPDFDELVGLSISSFISLMIFVCVCDTDVIIFEGYCAL